MLEKSVAALSITCAITFPLSAQTTEMANQPQVFQIVPVGRSAILLNTTTGESWMLDKKTSSWIPISKSESGALGQLPTTNALKESLLQQLEKLRREKAKLEYMIQTGAKLSLAPENAKDLIERSKKALSAVNKQIDSIEKRVRKHKSR